MDDSDDVYMKAWTEARTKGLCSNFRFCSNPVTTTPGTKCDECLGHFLFIRVCHLSASYYKKLRINLGRKPTGREVVQQIAHDWASIGSEGRQEWIQHSKEGGRAAECMRMGIDGKRR